MLNDIKQSTTSLIGRVTVAKEDGQALVEYSLILGLLSVVAIFALTTLGTDVRAALGTAAEALAGI
jgi:Flp pilus assembly pilin Flp